MIIDFRRRRVFNIWVYIPMTDEGDFDQEAYDYLWAKGIKPTSARGYDAKTIASLAKDNDVFYSTYDADLQVIDISITFQEDEPIGDL